MPVVLVKAGDHVPPISGVPPRLLNKSTGISVLQSSRLPLSPASLLLVEIVIVAELLPHELLTV